MIANNAKDLAIFPVKVSSIWKQGIIIFSLDSWEWGNEELLVFIYWEGSMSHFESICLDLLHYLTHVHACFYMCALYMILNDFICIYKEDMHTVCLFICVNLREASLNISVYWTLNFWWFFSLCCILTFMYLYNKHTLSLLLGKMLGKYLTNQYLAVSSDIFSHTI